MYLIDKMELSKHICQCAAQKQIKYEIRQID